MQDKLRFVSSSLGSCSFSEEDQDACLLSLSLFSEFQAQSTAQKLHQSLPQLPAQDKRWGETRKFTSPLRRFYKWGLHKCAGAKG